MTLLACVGGASGAYRGALAPWEHDAARRETGLPSRSRCLRGRVCFCAIAQRTRHAPSCCAFSARSLIVLIVPVNVQYLLVLPEQSALDHARRRLLPSCTDHDPSASTPHPPKAGPGQPSLGLQKAHPPPAYARRERSPSAQRGERCARPRAARTCLHS
ncbi:hypothetical protein BC628DRAFT_81146 [Trametes gibbosa]|nr:hypothetical protein BC628DRAFT_81146 [Trametes gibbosa]